MSPLQITEMCLFQQFLPVPFSLFHEAITTVFERSVYTHEFADRNALQQEFLKNKPAPTLQAIMDMIPPEKRITIDLSDTNENNEFSEN